MIQAVSGSSPKSSFSDVYKNRHNYAGSVAQVSFRGAPALARKVAGSRTIVRFAEESKDMLAGNLRKLTGKNQLPFTEKPIVAPSSLLGERNAALSHAKNNALSELKSRLNSGKLTEAKYRSKVDEITDYYDNAKSLPANIGSRSIISDQPSLGFKGRVVEADDIVDTSDIASDLGTESLKEAAQTLAEETIGEAGMQAIERGIDVIAPGAGVALTVARNVNRGVKAVKVAKKAGEYVKEKVADVVSDVVDSCAQSPHLKPQIEKETEEIMQTLQGTTDFIDYKKKKLPKWEREDYEKKIEVSRTVAHQWAKMRVVARDLGFNPMF